MFSRIFQIDGIGLVRPQLAVVGTEPVMVWTGTAGIEIARADGSRTRLREGSAGVRVAGGRRLWAVWDAGGQLHHGLAYHQDGVQLEAGVIDGALHGDCVADQLWDYCTGSATAIAIGEDDEPRLAWVVRDRVFHASRRDGAWVVDKGPLAERETIALAVAPDGRSHLLYQRDFRLRHACQNASEWIETIVADKYETEHATLALDRDGAPHIAFMGHSSSKDHLVYRRLGREATREIVDNKGNLGFGARIAVDDAGVPWIGYRCEHSRSHASSRRVAPVEHRVACRRGGGWSVAAVATGGAANDFALVAGVPWVAIAAGVNGNLAIMKGDDAWPASQSPQPQRPSRHSSTPSSAAKSTR
jgi:hypothetical protein